MDTQIKIRLLTESELDKIDDFFNKLDNAVSYGDGNPEHILMDELPSIMGLWKRCNISYTALVEVGDTNGQ